MQQKRNRHTRCTSNEELPLVVQVRLVDVIEVALEIAGGKPLCHGEILIQVVTALLGSGTGDRALKITDEPKELANERQNLLGAHLAEYNQVKTRAATHGTKVDDALGPLGIVAAVPMVLLLCGHRYLGRVATIKADANNTARTETRA